MVTREIRASRKYASGISLIELMIAIAIGLFITGVLSFVFVDSSRAFRELRKSGEQIENGRHALSLLADAIRHAGYFGQLGTFNAPVAVDPCVMPTLDHLASPIQVYSTALNAKAALPSCLAASEVAIGSDVLVVRRADTIPLVSAAVPTAIPLANAVYLQANPTLGQIQLGAGTSIDRTKKASGAAATILGRDGFAAPINRLHVEIYYVSPCSQVSCASGSDGIPTLKRMELATGTPTWTVVPLVSGIEYFQVDLGLDTLPAATTLATGLIGDGAADGAFVQTTTDWQNVVSVKVSLLARTLEATPGHTDTKKYLVSQALEDASGGAGYVSGSGAFKRKVFAAEVRLNNPSGRRERVAGEF
jgi:type IV pilus assembly protein PilW